MTDRRTRRVGATHAATREALARSSETKPGATGDAADSKRLLSQLALCGWLVVVALSLGLFIASVPARYAALSHPDAATRAGLAAYGVPVSMYAGYLTALHIIVAACFVAVGGAIAALTRAAPRARFVAATLITFGLALPGTTFAVITGRPISEISFNPLQGLGWFFLLLFAYLFPTGRFVPTWMRYLVPVWAAWVAVFFAAGNTAFARQPALIGLSFLVWVAWFATGAYAQYHRYWRVSGLAERYQTKWAALGFLAAIIGALIATAPHIAALSLRRLDLLDVRYQVIATTVMSLCGLLIPVTIGAAVLRRRLFEIDVIINRALIYGALSAILGGVYSLCVIALVGAGGAITGHFSVSAANEPLVFTVATLIVAALARPLRRRVQRAINRRFYRRRYDLQRILETFGAELNHQVELEQIRDRLLQTIYRTVQPSHISLWLAPIDHAERAARSRMRLESLNEQISQHAPM